MAEIQSKQAAVVAAGTKNLAPKMGLGKKVVYVITSPDTVTWAQGDTIASPHKLPKGSRILSDSYINCADMGTSITCDVGLRKASDGTAIDADGIAAAIDVATAATRAIANNGALVKDGVEYITTEDSYIYATLNGGTPGANAQIKIEVSVMLPS
jgi:hypothetical protein